MKPFWSVVVATLLAAACGGGDAGPDGSDVIVKRTVSAALAEGHTAELTIPDDWAHSTTDGMVVARHDADLDLDSTPLGPRIVIGVDHDVIGLTSESLPDSEAIADLGEVLDEPQELMLAGHPAVSIAIQLDTTVARFVAVTHDGTAHLVTAEAPAASWPDDGPLIDQILTNSLRFDTSTQTPTTSGQATSTDADPTTTTSDRPTIFGSGSEDDPFQVPYRETFAPPANPEWNRIIDEFGTWTWTVEDQQLVGTGDEIEVVAPRAPWAPKFDLPDLPAVAVELEIPDSTDTASCGVILGVDDGGNSLIVGVFIDAAQQRYLVWSPVDFTDLADGLPWTTDSRIRQDGGNDLRLILDVPLPGGEQILISVNGEELATTPTIGPVTAIAPSALFEPGNQPGECRFDNLSVTR